MSMKREELDLSIDENDLLNEWKSQASMMLDYGIMLADALQEQDEAKARLSVVTAELDNDIRKDPDAYDIGKITEAAIFASIPVQPEHKVATKALDAARHECRVLQAVVDALAHRKSALQGMTELFMRQWYADPKSAGQPAELREAANSGPPTKTINRRTRRPAE